MQLGCGGRRPAAGEELGAQTMPRGWVSRDTTSAGLSKQPSVSCVHTIPATRHPLPLHASRTHSRCMHLVDPGNARHVSVGNPAACILGGEQAGTEWGRTAAQPRTHHPGTSRPIAAAPSHSRPRAVHGGRHPGHVAYVKWSRTLRAYRPGMPAHRPGGPAGRPTTSGSMPVLRKPDVGS